MRDNVMSNLKILVNIIGKNIFETVKISLYQKLLLIAKSYYLYIATTQPYKSLFALYSEEHDKYIYVTVKPDNVEKAINELITHKFPLHKCEIFPSFEQKSPYGNLHIKTFLPERIDEIFNSIPVTSNVSLNYSDALYDRVRKNPNIQNIKELVCFTDALPEPINDKQLKKCITTLKYIDKYNLMIGEYINLDVLVALTAYLVHHRDDPPVTKTKNGVKYKLL